MGIPDSVVNRVANLVDAPPPPNAPAPLPLFEKCIPAGLPAAASLFNRPDVRRASIPGAGGIMTARDLARFYASMAGAVDGVRLLPPARVALIARERRRDLDQVLEPRDQEGPRATSCTAPTPSPSPTRQAPWPPAAPAGSVGWADPARGLALGFAKTLLVSPVDRWKATDVLVSAKVCEVLGIP